MKQQNSNIITSTEILAPLCSLEKFSIIIFVYTVPIWFGFKVAEQLLTQKNS